MANKKEIKESMKKVDRNTAKPEKKEKKENFFKKAFKDMAESAKAQAAVDKANLEAVKAESRATWEENQGANTLKKAKAMSKKSWEDAKMSPAERQAKIREEQEKQIAQANERTAAAKERTEKAKAYRAGK